VLFVGRLSPTKGPIEAAEAWRLSGLDLPLVVAGAGPMRQGLEKRGAEVLGWLDHERLSVLYKRARVVVMPSRWQEPFGIVGLEALTMGVPVAAWRSGGVAEWHPGDGLVPWGDVPGLAAALREVAGRRPAPPAGFERARLMGRLAGVYETAGTFSAARGNG
jgi:glycosyltransferase involved in cell wall biosynthesis